MNFFLHEAHRCDVQENAIPAQTPNALGLKSNHTRCRNLREGHLDQRSSDSVSKYSQVSMTVMWHSTDTCRVLCYSDSD